MGLKPADLWYAPNKVNIVLVFWGVDRSNLSDLSGDLINPVACFTCQRSSHCCHSKAGIREHVLLPQLLPCKVQNLKALKPIIQANSCLTHLLEPTCLSLPFGWLLYKAQENGIWMCLWFQFIDYTWTVTATPSGCVFVWKMMQVWFPCDYLSDCLCS